MGMSIDNLAYDYGDDTYYTSGFHDFFLSYYFYFKNPSNNLLTEVAINPGDAYRYQGDLTSLLLSLNIEPEYHWCVMVLNNMKSTTEVTKDTLSLFIPDINEIQQLKSVYESLI